jgi:sugar phosphate isomerase/epimerase
MGISIKRSGFLKSLAALPALALTGTPGFPALPAKANPPAAPGLKISLNAYSFNDPLAKGDMSLDGLLEFCSTHGFDAVDLTGYYFPGYPTVPSDEYIYHVKRMAFRLGLDISGTGVRNDFTEPDPSKRKLQVALVKNWIDVAAKLGAPVIRIFSGVQNPKGFSRAEVEAWMVRDIQECVAFAQTRGVIVGIQNHNDFIRTADDVLGIFKKVKSEWFGLVLDIGSYQTGDVYSQVKETAPLAVNWQIKENVFVDGKEVATDLDKIFAIVKGSGYRGYLPIETLGAGDPKIKVPKFLEKVRIALKKD